MNILFRSLTKYATLAALFALPTVAQAGGSLDISLADTSARVGWDATRVSSGMHLNLGLLHETDEGDLANVGLHVVDIRKLNANLYIGVGGNAYVFNSDDNDGAAVGVGAFFRYKIPAYPEVSIAGHAYYAPPVVSFSDIENMVDMDVRVQYSVLSSAHAYIGLRGTSLKFEDNDDREGLGDGVHLGLRLDF